MSARAALRHVKQKQLGLAPCVGSEAKRTRLQHFVWIAFEERIRLAYARHNVAILLETLVEPLSSR